MFVEDSGKNHEGKSSTKTWSLVAGEGDGPYIPGIPVVIIIKKLTAGALPMVGARPCLRLFDTQEFPSAVEDLDISVRFD